MIISASRRTDLPAFYAEWFMNRIRAGFCTVANPFNARQIARVSLAPADVEAIVFWTRNPRSLMPHLGELDARGYAYIFQFTLLGSPRTIEPASPALTTALDAFRRLSDRIGPERVIWRFDPIFLTTLTPAEFHAQAFERIARTLSGYTTRCMISLVHPYRKTHVRLRQLEREGVAVLPADGPGLDALIGGMAQVAHSCGIEIQSCTEAIRGIAPGRCIDGALISRLFGIALETRKDPHQRSGCGCAVSKDIGAYDTCLAGCPYCYATTSFARAEANHRRHDPGATGLLSSQDTGTSGKKGEEGPGTGR